jgi:hypothetical protein
VKALAGQDLELAKIIHYKLRLRQEFPQNIQELVASNLFPGTDPISLQLRIDYAPKGAYIQPQVASALAGLTTDEQNAALLALVLAQTRKDYKFDGELAGAAATATFPGNSLRYFKDAWGRPINFRRTPDSIREPFLGDVVDELNNAPYVDVTKPITLTHGLDPLDPDNRLQRPNAAAVKSFLDGVLGPVNDGRNRVMAIFSQGRVEGLTGDEMYGFRITSTGRAN